jgi:hypothetical protein
MRGEILILIIIAAIILLTIMGGSYALGYCHAMQWCKKQLAEE